MNEIVGSQDQVVATYGGFNKIIFNKNGSINVKKIKFKKNLKLLNRNLVLIFTGINRTAHYIAQKYVGKLTSTKKKYINKIVSYVDGNPTVFKNGQPATNIKLTLTVDSAAASNGPDTSYDSVSEAKVIIGGQGFSSSSKTRKAIELASMDKAQEHYRSLGWNVEDVSSNHPYDLRCTMPAESELHVEVKGTTGDGSSVLLTPGDKVVTFKSKAKTL